MFARDGFDQVTMQAIAVTKPDAISKAKGLSEYARRHADQLGHIDMIAKVGDRFCRLHLERGAIRIQVDRLGDSLAELQNLYLREG
jgi:hypothetical protein